MKQHKRLPLALLLVFALCIQILSFTSAAAALADPEPVFSASDMTFSSGTDAVALSPRALSRNSLGCRAVQSSWTSPPRRCPRPTACSA